jgi:hypothetical protein
MAAGGNLVTAANAGGWESLKVLSELTLAVLSQQGYACLSVAPAPPCHCCMMLAPS